MFNVLNYRHLDGEGGAYTMNRLRELREKKGLSQEELAEKSGVSRTTISFLETGKSDVAKTDTLGKLAIALDSTVGDIFFCS
jgi:transcriptional regulator with XRE-family HTH domain